MITIDGETFDVGIYNIKRTASIERQSLGQTYDGRTHENTIGTRYDYSVTFITKKMNIQEYNRLYEVLTNPVDYHNVTMPYNDSTITFDAKINGASDSIIQSFNAFRRWSSLTINFESVEIQKLVE